MGEGLRKPFTLGNADKQGVSEEKVKGEGENLVCVFIFESKLAVRVEDSLLSLDGQLAVLAVPAGCSSEIAVPNGLLGISTLGVMLVSLGVMLVSLRDVSGNSRRCQW